MVQQQEYTVRILFEDDGWQIIDHDSDVAYLIHAECKAYKMLMNIEKGCTVCNNSAPAGIQALVVLWNWRT